MTPTDPSDRRRETKQWIDNLIASAVEPATASDDATPERSLRKTAYDLDRLRLRDHRLDYALKKALGRWAIRLLAAQMVITNAGCIAYGYVVVDRGGDIPTEALIGWMSATIVEIVALALVVAKYLFPESGNNWNHEPPRLPDEKK